MEVTGIFLIQCFFMGTVSGWVLNSVVTFVQRGLDKAYFKEFEKREKDIIEKYKRVRENGSKEY
jgi:hypothetical protein